MYARLPHAGGWDPGAGHPESWSRIQGEPRGEWESMTGGLSDALSGRSFTRPDLRVLTRRQVDMKDGTTGTLIRMNVPDGDDGVWATLWLMEYAVVRDQGSPLLTRIARQHGASSERATAKALFRYLVGHYPYRRDPQDREFVHGPVRTLSKTSPYGYRDCDDLAVALSGLLTAAGIRNAFTVIAWRPDAPQQFTHVYNEAYIDGKWIPMDAVMGHDGWNNKRSPVNRRARWIVGDHVSMRGGKAAALGANALGVDAHSADALGVDALNDDDVNKGEVSIDFEAMAKDILTRSLPVPLGKGENAGEVLKQHFLAICVSGLKAQLYQHRVAIAGIGIGGALIFTTIGFAAGTMRARRTMKRGRHVR